MAIRINREGVFEKDLRGFGEAPALGIGFSRAFQRASANPPKFRYNYGRLLTDLRAQISPRDYLRAFSSRVIYFSNDTIEAGDIHSLHTKRPLTIMRQFVGMKCRGI